MILLYSKSSLRVSATVLNAAINSHMKMPHCWYVTQAGYLLRRTLSVLQAQIRSIKLLQIAKMFQIFELQIAPFTRKIVKFSW